MAARGLEVERFSFSAAFARNLDYYTGFIFEVQDPRRRMDKPIVGGGRYDGLLQHLGEDRTIAAVGCSFWLDRIVEQGPMTESPLILAVPSKGRLQENAAAFFARAGLVFSQSRGALDYRGTLKGVPDVEVAFVSASEIVNQLATGAAIWELPART